MASVSTVLLLALCAFGAQALYKNQAFNHKGTGYAVPNRTVTPTPDACDITNVSLVASVTKNCTTINVGSFTVPAASQPLILNLLNGTTITFTGQLIFSKNATKGFLIEILGNNLRVIGSSTHLFNGQGDQYWDGLGGAGTPKPTFMYLKGIGNLYNGLSLRNCPERCVAIDGSNNVILNNFLIDNRAGANGTAAKGKEGHNTDGFDVSKSQFVTIQNSVVFNQDDCVAINDGMNMIINNVNCSGSHGFDIATGISKTNATLNTVRNVTFSNSFLFNSLYGLHILTCNDGGTGSVSEIHYKNIQFSGTSDYGIMIQQDFSNSKQGSTGVPLGNIPISNVTVTNVTGVMTGANSLDLSLRCAIGACKNITFNTVSVTGGKKKNECWNFTIPGFC